MRLIIIVMKLNSFGDKRKCCSFIQQIFTESIVCVGRHFENGATRVNTIAVVTVLTALTAVEKKDRKEISK